MPYTPKPPDLLTVIGRAVKDNGWPSTLLILALLAAWRVWARFEPVATILIQTHIEAITELTKNNAVLTESDKKRGSLLREIRDEQGSHTVKLDRIIDRLSTKENK